MSEEEAARMLILMNTCGVREQAEQKANDEAGYITAKKQKEANLILGIMGCDSE